MTKGIHDGLIWSDHFIQRLSERVDNPDIVNKIIAFIHTSPDVQQIPIKDSWRITFRGVCIVIQRFTEKGITLKTIYRRYTSESKWEVIIEKGNECHYG